MVVEIGEDVVRVEFEALLQTLRRSGGMRSGREGRAVSDFKGRHFEGEIVLWAVRWYCRYGVSYRDLEQMMGERGVSVDHSTIFRWVQKYAPEIAIPTGFVVHVLGLKSGAEPAHRLPVGNHLFSDRVFSRPCRVGYSRCGWISAVPE